MTNELLIQFKLAPGLAALIDESVASGLYANRSEFLRDAVRSRLAELDRHGLARRLRGEGPVEEEAPSRLDRPWEPHELPRHVRHWDEHRTAMAGRRQPRER